MVSKCGSAHVLNLYLEDIDCIHLKAMCDCCKYITVPKIIFGTVIYCITVDLVFVPHQKKCNLILITPFDWLKKQG